MFKLQSNLEEKANPSILKDDFASRTESSIFILVAPALLDQSKETSWNQQATSCSSPQSFMDQTQIQKPILVVATNKMLEHT